MPEKIHKRISAKESPPEKVCLRKSEGEGPLERIGRKRKVHLIRKVRRRRGLPENSP